MKGLDKYLTTNPFDEVRGTKRKVFAPAVPKITNAGLSNATLRVLTLNGFTAWRNNNIPTFDAKRNIRHYRIPKRDG